MRQRVVRWFYGPPDWLVARTDVRTRRAINFWLLIVWLIPGMAVWIMLRSALWFLGFMTIYGLWGLHYGSFASETPVETEE